MPRALRLLVVRAQVEGTGRGDERTVRCFLALYAVLMSRGVRGVMPRRWLRRGLLATGVIVIAWLVACYLIVVDPTVNRTTRADAVVVLGPPTEDGRLETALTLMNQGYASNLVISLNSPKQRRASDVCARPPA